MANTVYYDIICLKCGETIACIEIGEYPWSWQVMNCTHCDGVGTPDLEHPHYITADEARLRDSFSRLQEENEQLKKRIAFLEEARERAMSWVSPIPNR